MSAIYACMGEELPSKGKGANDCIEASDRM